MADVSNTLVAWSSTTSNNAPSGATAIGSGLDDNLREIQGVLVRNLHHKGSDIASATTTDLGAVEGIFHDITGTTTITSFGTVREGVWKFLKFEGALTLTYNATSLILPGATNIKTTVGDTCVAFSEGSGNWRVVAYMRASGSPVNVVNVVDFGADPTGVADSTTAIQAAINSLGILPGTVFFPKGTFLVTSTVTVGSSRHNLLGLGTWASQINFVPTANTTCIKFIDTGPAVVYQFVIRDLGIFSGDTTYTSKIALELVDVSTYALDKITIRGGTATAGGSFSGVAIKIRGRECGWYRNIDISATVPYHIAANPNSSAISLDHHTFDGGHIIGATGNPVVKIDDVTNLTNLKWTNQALVGGSYGIYWNCPNGTGPSQNIEVSNCRWEGGDVGGNFVHFVPSASGLYNVSVNDCSYGNNLAVVKGPKIGSTASGALPKNVKLSNLYYESAGVAMDLNCDIVELNALYFSNSSATVSLNNSTRVTGYINIGTNISGVLPVATTWTPTDNSGASLSFANVSAFYTQVGNIIHAWARFDYPVTANGNNASIGGLPATTRNNNYSRAGSVLNGNAPAGTQLLPIANTTTAEFLDGSLAAITNATLSAKIIFVYFTYLI